MPADEGRENTRCAQTAAQQLVILSDAPTLRGTEGPKSPTEPTLPQLPEFAQITNGHSLWCADCNLGLEPTSTNPIGYVFCILAQHDVHVGLELLGFDRLDAVIDRAFARAHQERSVTQNRDASTCHPEQAALLPRAEGTKSPTEQVLP